EPVGYVPVKNVDEMLKTLELGPITTKKLDDNRFEIVGRQQSLFARMEDGYAFVANSEAVLDRDFSDAVRLATRLSAAYDVAGSINLRTLPEATRELFLGFMRTSTEIELQRRDTEPESAHRVRK